MIEQDRVLKTRNITQQRGSTMIIAVWALFLLTTFAVQLGVIVRQKVTVVHRLDNRNNRYFIAEAGIKHAIVELRKNDAFFTADFLSERWSDQQDLFKYVRVGKGSFSINHEGRNESQPGLLYGLQDEESKINLNKTDVHTLKRLLQSVSALAALEAEDLAYCIIDWRDKDSFFQHPQFGAEDSDYKSLRHSYESKDEDFEVIEELLLVKKMDQETFDKIKPYVTVFGEGMVNINTAPREVLLALGISDYVVDNILIFRAGGDLIEGTGDDNIFLQSSTIVSRLSQAFDLSPSEIASLSNLVSANQFVVKSENFLIRSIAELDHRDGQTTILAVADRTGQIKYWQEEI